MGQLRSGGGVGRLGDLVAQRAERVLVRRHHLAVLAHLLQELRPPLGGAGHLGAVLVQPELGAGDGGAAPLDEVAELEGLPVHLGEAGGDALGARGELLRCLGQGPDARLDGLALPPHLLDLGPRRLGEHPPEELRLLGGDAPLQPGGGVLHGLHPPVAVPEEGEGVETAAGGDEGLDALGDLLALLDVPAALVQGPHHLEGLGHLALGGGPPHRHRRQHGGHVEGLLRAADELVEVPDRVLVHGEDGVDLVPDRRVLVDDPVVGLDGLAVPAQLQVEVALEDRRLGSEGALRREVGDHGGGAERLLQAPGLHVGPGDLVERLVEAGRLAGDLLVAIEGLRDPPHLAVDPAQGHEAELAHLPLPSLLGLERSAALEALGGRRQIAGLHQQRPLQVGGGEVIGRRHGPQRLAGPPDPLARRQVATLVDPLGGEVPDLGRRLVRPSLARPRHQLVQAGVRPRADGHVQRADEGLPLVRRPLDGEDLAQVGHGGAVGALLVERFGQVPERPGVVGRAPELQAVHHVVEGHGGMDPVAEEELDLPLRELPLGGGDAPLVRSRRLRLHEAEALIQGDDLPIRLSDQVGESHAGHRRGGDPQGRRREALLASGCDHLPLPPVVEAGIPDPPPPGAEEAPGDFFPVSSFLTSTS